MCLHVGRVTRVFARVTKTKSLGILIDQFLSWGIMWRKYVKKHHQELARSGDSKVVFLASHLYQFTTLWFNHILTTAALFGTQLDPRFQIEFRLYKIEQQGSY